MAHELAYREIIFNEQNRLVAFGEIGRRGLLVLDFGGMQQAWQKTRESRSYVDFARDLNPTLMLFRDAIHDRKTQAGAAAEFFGGKERFENAREIFGRDPAAGVLDGETNELARPRIGMPLRITRR